MSTRRKRSRTPALAHAQSQTMADAQTPKKKKLERPSAELHRVLVKNISEDTSEEKLRMFMEIVAEQKPQAIVVGSEPGAAVVDFQDAVDIKKLAAQCKRLPLDGKHLTVTSMAVPHDPAGSGEIPPSSPEDKPGASASSPKRQQTVVRIGSPVIKSITSSPASLRSFVAFLKSTCNARYEFSPKTQPNKVILTSLQDQAPQNWEAQVQSAVKKYVEPIKISQEKK